MDAAKEYAQVNLVVFCFFSAAMCYIFTYSLGSGYSVAWMHTSSLSPSALTSTDPTINERMAVVQGLGTSILLTQRLVNLFTGKAMGEWGQVIGRKKLILIALGGYGFGALIMFIGFLMSTPYTWDGCYGKCMVTHQNYTKTDTDVVIPACSYETSKEIADFVKKSPMCTGEKAATTSTGTCEPQFALTNTSSVAQIMRYDCTVKCCGDAVQKNWNFNGAWAYFVSQALIGFCAPLGITVNSYLVDLASSEERLKEHFAKSMAFGYGGGLGLGYVFGLIFLIIGIAGRNMNTFFLLSFASGTVFGFVPMIVAALKLEEPVKPENRKVCCAKPIEYFPFTALVYPCQLGGYTMWIYLCNCCWGFMISVWESNIGLWLAWGYGLPVTHIFIYVFLFFAMQILGNKVFVVKLGLRKAFWFSMPFAVTCACIYAFTSGKGDAQKSCDNKEKFSPTTGLIVMFTTAICMFGFTGAQTSALALLNSQGDDKSTGPIAGAWKVGEAFFKTLGTLSGYFARGWIVTYACDPTQLKGMVWLAFFIPAGGLMYLCWFMADCKNGDTNRLQAEQKEKIFGIQAKFKEGGNDAFSDSITAPPETK